MGLLGDWDRFGISIGIVWGAAEAKKKGLEFTTDDDFYAKNDVSRLLISFIRCTYKTSIIMKMVILTIFSGVCWSLRGQGGGDGLSFCQVAVGRGHKHILIMIMVTHH